MHRIRCTLRRHYVYGSSCRLDDLEIGSWLDCNRHVATKHRIFHQLAGRFWKNGSRFAAMANRIVDGSDFAIRSIRVATSKHRHHHTALQRDRTRFVRGEIV